MTSEDIGYVAADMVKRLRQTGEPVEHWLDSDERFKLILRRRENQIQLVTVCWSRQPSTAERQVLRDKFNIPEDTAPTFGYNRGWGIMKLTWSDAKPAQAALFETEETTKTKYYTMEDQ